MILLALLAVAGATDELPPPPEKPAPALPEPVDPPAFGADVSLGLGPASLLGVWPEPGVHGLVLGRYEAFARDRHASGPRLGLSIWAATTAWPLQQATEDSGTLDIRYLHYGLAGVIRHDPAAPLTGTAGLGFGRLDLEDYWGGPLALPTLTFEAGLRQRLDPQTFLDWNLRAHWATARSGEVPTLLEEWWMVGFNLALGRRLR